MTLRPSGFCNGEGTRESHILRTFRRLYIFGPYGTFDAYDILLFLLREDGRNGFVIIDHLQGDKMSHRNEVFRRIDLIIIQIVTLIGAHHHVVVLARSRYAPLLPQPGHHRRVRGKAAL